MFPIALVWLIVYFPHSGTVQIPFSNKLDCEAQAEIFKKIPETKTFCIPAVVDLPF